MDDFQMPDTSKVAIFHEGSDGLDGIAGREERHKASTKIWVSDYEPRFMVQIANTA